MLSKIIKLIVAGIILMFAISAFAQEDRDENGPPIPPHPMMGLRNIPGLTTDQLSKIDKLQLEHRKAVLPVRTKLEAAQLELKSLILESADLKKIDDQINEIGKVKTEMMKLRVRHQLDIRNLLTDEQKVYFDANDFRPPFRHGEMDFGHERKGCGEMKEHHQRN
jgi:Spy/CpxP family protein refolding chaperone